MYANKLVAFLFLISVKVYSSSFIDYIDKSWSSGYKVTINKNYTTSLKIDEPKGTTQYIVRVDYLNKDFKKLSDCLIYQIPRTGESGSLYIHLLNNNKSCEDVLFEKHLFSIEEVYNFGISYKENILKLIIDNKTKQIKLLNSKFNTDNKIYDHIASRMYLEGVQISRVERDSNTEYYKDGSICLDVDNKCEVIKNTNCDLCQNGTHNIIASNCPSKVRRVCGIKECGEKGNPACIRGFLATKYMGDYCIPDSPVGFCKKGLRVFCENGELICN